MTDSANSKKKRRSGIPTGNAGEYFVMGELLRRNFDAQLADRNTKGYDIHVSRPGEALSRKVQVKTVRAQPWYVKIASFKDDLLDQVTVYVLLGKDDCRNPVRYFIAKNKDLAAHVSPPANWKNNAFMSLKAVEKYEGRWDILDSKKEGRVKSTG